MELLIIRGALLSVLYLQWDAPEGSLHKRRRRGGMWGLCNVPDGGMIKISAGKPYDF